MKESCAGAVEDFSMAVKMAPQYGDAWKRRGQAYSALGKQQEALEVIKLTHNTFCQNPGSISCRDALSFGPQLYTSNTGDQVTMV